MGLLEIVEALDPAAKDEKENMVNIVIESNIARTFSL